MNPSANMGNGTDLHLLAGAYALGALDELEERRFEAHLPGCESCRSDLVDFGGAVEYLGAQVEEAAPASLKAKVMAEVDQTRQVSVAQSRRAPRAGRVASLVAAVAVVVALGAGGLFVRAENRVDRLEQIAAVYQAEDGAAVRLPTDSGLIQVSVAPQAGRAVIDAANLVALDAGLVYQLWIINDGVPLPEATFDSSEVAGSLILDLDNPLKAGSVLAVTIEPDGGSLQPSGTPIGASAPI